MGIDMFSAKLATSSRTNLVLPRAPLASTFANSQPQVRANVMRGSNKGSFSALAAAPVSMSCSRPGTPAMSVNAMQEKLRKHGVPSSPLEKYVLTKFAATRDVSLAAQAKEEFSRLDPETKAKLRKLTSDVVVRAGDVDEIAGVTGPIGFFDPLELASDENIATFRGIELKHGRVCMLASLGIIVSEAYHPIYDAWGDGEFVSAAATHFSATAAGKFWPAFLVLTLSLEILGKVKDPDNTGDLGFDPLKLKPDNEEEFIALQNKELNNGRLAMFGSAGILVQELLTGEKIFR